MVFRFYFVENQTISQQSFYPQQQGLSVIQDSAVILQNVSQPAQIISNRQTIPLEQSHNTTFSQSPYLIEANAPTSIHTIITDPSLQVENGDFLESKRLKLAGVDYYCISLMIRMNLSQKNVLERKN